MEKRCMALWHLIVRHGEVSGGSMMTGADAVHGIDSGMWGCAGPEKDYVQHKLKQEAAAVWALIQPEAKGYVYVCGDAKHMAKDVHRELVEMARLACGGSASQGEAALQKLVDLGRYQRDVW